jgi:DNA primase
VSTPVTWEEIESGVKMDAFRIENVPDRVKELGDLWKPLLGKKRVNLKERFGAQVASRFKVEKR